ncbi:MAG: tetraacyldisaccharide 4'-kinase [Bacteroidales bacterium]|nr:tetraacyldisaccharide 4'-kinase [Bacteroidales bacterium]
MLNTKFSMIWRYLLFPIALGYGLTMWFRRQIIYRHLRKPYTATIPVISVGNLCMGGAGKTPMVEYLIRLLAPQYSIATLSRGYKRKTKGALIANDCPQVDAAMIGDEPFQYYHKYKNILVAVAEKRAEGMQLLLKNHPQCQVMLLDDAFQHLKVNRSVNILLTEYENPWVDDFVLPVGNLREFRTTAKAADIVVVTKSPALLSQEEADNFVKKLKITDNQSVFFTTIQYQPLTPFTACAKEYSITPNAPVVLLAGIAHPSQVIHYLETQFTEVIPLIFDDHHHYSPQNLRRIEKIISQHTDSVVVTTEKDAMRLMLPEIESLLSRLPIFTLPIEIAFLFNETEHFNQLIYDIIRKNSR